MRRLRFMLLIGLVPALLLGCSRWVAGPGTGTFAEPSAIAPVTSTPTLAHQRLETQTLASTEGLAVTVTDDPLAALNARLSASSGTCFVLTHATKSVDGQDLDRRIASAGGPGNFLSTWVWAAPPDTSFADAAREFEASWAAARDAAGADGWIEVNVDGRPTGIELLAYTTPLGHTVWLRTSTLASASCDGNN